MTSTESSSAEKRLREFLSERFPGFAFSLQELTPDASTREYFRVLLDEETHIACVYPKTDFGIEQLRSCLDVTNVFLEGKLPVSEIELADDSQGIILHQDFGDRILRDALNQSDDSERERLIDDAIKLIPRIQAATEIAFDENSIASRLKFDVEKLNWELQFFKTHYFGSLMKRELESEISRALDLEFMELSRELESRASVLCHRDFHAANLMIGIDGELKIIDHQDARIGSASYDLVSLLLDRVTELPSPEWLAEKRRLFLSERERIGLPAIDESEFADEFRLQTIQRCLKAIGTFSNQAANRGKSNYIQYIKPMFWIGLRALENLGKYPALRRTVEEEI